MKTKFFKFGMPVAFVALGLVGALSSNAMEKKATVLASETGYKKVIGAAQPCQPVESCDNVPAQLCKSSIDNSQLYHFVGNNQCPTMLFRSIP